MFDPATWPRYGTEWGHVVSDTSLAELHEVASRAGLHPRSFDLDHYDYPRCATRALLQAGAQPVDSHILVRALIGSGLRIPARMREAARCRRTREAAADLGISAPDDLICGMRGHTVDLPARPGAFRITRNLGRYGMGLVAARTVPRDGYDLRVHTRIEAHDELGRERAASFLARVDRVVASARRGRAVMSGRGNQAVDTGCIDQTGAFALALVDGAVAVGRWDTDPAQGLRRQWIGQVTD